MAIRLEGCSEPDVIYSNEVIPDAGVKRRDIEVNGMAITGKRVSRTIWRRLSLVLMYSWNCSGVGERSGNAPLDQTLVNLSLMGVISNDLTNLSNTYRRRINTLRSPAKQLPGIWTGCFRNRTGVHASAVVRALRKGDSWLADRVYSGVPNTEISDLSRS